MKKLIVMAMVSLSMYANAAEKQLLSCMVSENSPEMKLMITVSEESSVDFATFTLTEKSGTTMYFTQFDKGAIDEQMKQGVLSTILLTDSTKNENGVITNSGIISLQKENDLYSGVLVAKGNIYPLACK